MSKDKFNPLVSIVIPVYNGENYLKEAIDSALAQSYDNIEIIVVNDGSTDKTDEIASSYGNKIRYFKKKNGGTSTALNYGIKKMKGRYFSWLSHDDQYYPDKIKRQIEELAKLDNKNTIMMTDLDGINEKYEPIYKTNFQARIDEYPPREKSDIYPVVYNQTHGCTLLIPKTCFEKVGLFDETELVAQDFEFFYRAFQKFPHKLVPEVLVIARDSPGRQGHAKNDLRVEGYSNLYIKIIKDLSDEDIKLLAPNKLNFYDNMVNFFSSSGYEKALEFIRKKFVKNLQISSYDLIGNKFNGYDLHLYLREEGVDSEQLVLYKDSYGQHVYNYNFSEKGSTKNLLMEKLFLESQLVHLHLIHNLIDINYLPIITRLKPTIISLHDPYFFGGHCVHHFDCKKWQTHCENCPYLNEVYPITYDYSALNFSLLKKAISESEITAVVASKWMENKIKKSPIWKGKKVYVLPFGINQQIFKPNTNSAKKELKIPKDSITLMFRADQGSFKGLDTIKKALKKIKTKNKITLITVGEKGLLKEFADKYKIIEFKWIKDDSMLASLYQACDIFLMPSRQESFGMMAIEAMSCGKMVLGTNGEGTALPDIIKSPNYGLATNEENYYKELQKLISNPKEIYRRGKKCLEYAKKNYSKENYVNGMLSIYKKTIKNHHIDKEAKLVLDQLYEHTKLEKSSRLRNPENSNIINKIFRKLSNKVSIETRKKIRIYFLILFYKVDKIVPKKIRKKVKKKLIKYSFVKLYLIP